MAAQAAAGAPAHPSPPPRCRHARRGKRTTARTVLLALWTASISCTPVRDFSQVDREISVSVDAVQEVRSELDDVEVVLESRMPDANSWRLLESQRFTPDPGAPEDWPLAFRVKGYDPEATYQVTATARGEAGAVTIQARSISEPGPNATSELRLRFDSECLRPKAAMALDSVWCCALTTC